MNLTLMKKYYLLLLCGVFLYSIPVQAQDTTHTSSADTTVEGLVNGILNIQDTPEQKGLIQQINQFTREFLDVNMLVKSLQVRHKGKSKIIKRLDKDNPIIPIELSLFTYLDTSSFWAKSLTGKWRFTSNGKLKPEEEYDIPAFDLNLIFHPDSSLKSFTIESEIIPNQLLEEYLEGENIEIQSKLDTIVNFYFSSSFTAPKEAPVNEAIQEILLQIQHIEQDTWKRLVAKTASARNLYSQEDVKKYAEKLDQAILNNQNERNKEVPLMDGFQYIIDEILLPEESKNRLALSFAEINHYLPLKHYVITLQSNYAYSVTDIEKLAQKVLEHSKYALEEGVQLHIHQVTTSELLSGLIAMASYDKTNNSSFGNQKISYSQDVYMGENVKESIVYELNEFVCASVDHIQETQPSIVIQTATQTCDALHQERRAFTLLEESEVQHKATIPAQTAFYMPSGIPVMASSSLVEVNFDHENGFVTGFIYENVTYKSLVWYHKDDPDKTTQGFKGYLAENNTLLDCMSDSCLQEHLFTSSLQMVESENVLIAGYSSECEKVVFNSIVNYNGQPSPGVWSQGEMTNCKEDHVLEEIIHHTSTVSEACQPEISPVYIAYLTTTFDTIQQEISTYTTAYDVFMNTTSETRSSKAALINQKRNDAVIPGEEDEGVEIEYVVEMGSFENSLGSGDVGSATAEPYQSFIQADDIYSKHLLSYRGAVSLTNLLQQYASDSKKESLAKAFITEVLDGHGELLSHFKPFALKSIFLKFIETYEEN